VGAGRGGGGKSGAEAVRGGLGRPPLARRVSIDVVTEGRDTVSYDDLSDNAAIAAINDPLVAFSIVGGATALPAATTGVPLAGGRPAGPAIGLAGGAAPAPPPETPPVPRGAGGLAPQVDPAAPP